MSVKQNTLKGEFSLKGKGLHTGKEVCATFKPAAENTGYKIVRVDLDEKTEIPALAKYIELVDRASCLQKDGAKVYTLEHAMAALYGCGIDNCVIELSGEEFPILDGRATSRTPLFFSKEKNGILLRSFGYPHYIIAG